MCSVEAVSHLGKRIIVRLYSVFPSALRLRLVRLFTPNYTAGVTVLLVRESGEVLFLKPTYRLGWGLPGGLLDRHEHPEETAQREVAEELGIHIERPIAYRTAVDPRRQTVTWFAMSYVNKEQIAAIRPDPVEIAEVYWVAIDEMPPLDDEIAPIETSDAETLRHFLGKALAKDRPS